MHMPEMNGTDQQFRFDFNDYEEEEEEDEEEVKETHEPGLKETVTWTKRQPVLGKAKVRSISDANITPLLKRATSQQL